jgi:hypothetical protein
MRRSKRQIQAHLCTSYEAAMRACIKEFVEFWAEHENDPYVLVSTGKSFSFSSLVAFNGGF